MSDIRDINEQATAFRKRGEPEIPAQEARRVSPVQSIGVLFGGPAIVIGASIASIALGILARPQGRRATGVIRSAAVIGAALPWVYELAISPWMRSWGATPQEVRMELPGDDIIPHPAYETTHAITINAPASRIWPWLVQIGYKRGGWYSYDYLEDLAGAGEFYEGHSANRIIPELQGLKEGDVILLAPGLEFSVVGLTLNKALILQASDPTTGERVYPNPSARSFYAAAWVFVLNEIDESTTRLIARFRSDGEPRAITGAALHYFLESPHFIMERKMLKGIKKRSERAGRVQGVVE